MYITIGTFFLLSVFMAIVFDNYKKRMQELQEKKVSKRMDYISKFFDHFDEQGLGWLNMKQTRKFFELVLDLNMKKSKHRRMMRQILKIVDPDGDKQILKENVLDFFEISGFKIIHQLCKEQMKLEEMVN